MTKGNTFPVFSGRACGPSAARVHAQSEQDSLLPHKLGTNSSAQQAMCFRQAPIAQNPCRCVCAQDANGESDLWDFALGQGAAEGPGSPRPQSPKRALGRLSVDIEARPLMIMRHTNDVLSKDHGQGLSYSRFTWRCMYYCTYLGYAVRLGMLGKERSWDSLWGARAGWEEGSVMAVQHTAPPDQARAPGARRAGGGGR